ncbi:MAG: class I SAM-dependent methyltransferase [Candidatus Dormibacteraeota bacterium]|uniref:Class I SAM-dependent methyltransferase n=1 Tax=Candidatus Aeolococcus gillhamiae TaxID=3127015 RepID=A0A934JUD5_9BACT|nr:class I SAM-dependent methyltransferase [Candidatus Dormibacteraeota bacterium]
MAASYDRRASRWDRVLGLDAGRRWVCERAHGDVLELGVGTGLSLPHYPPEVRLTCIDATSEMLAVAQQRATELGVIADFRVGDAQALDVDSASVDTVIFTLSLCTIPMPARAIGEAWRVLRPDGRLLLIEHVRSPNAVIRTGQRLLDPLFRRLEADNLFREPLEHVRRLGFRVEELERSACGIVERLRATKP